MTPSPAHRSSCDGYESALRPARVRLETYVLLSAGCDLATRTCRDAWHALWSSRDAYETLRMTHEPSEPAQRCARRAISQRALPRDAVPAVRTSCDALNDASPAHRGSCDGYDSALRPARVRLETYVLLSAGCDLATRSCRDATHALWSSRDALRNASHDTRALGTCATLRAAQRSRSALFPVTHCLPSVLCATLWETPRVGPTRSRDAITPIWRPDALS